MYADPFSFNAALAGLAAARRRLALRSAECEIGSFSGTKSRRNRAVQIDASHRLTSFIPRRSRKPIVPDSLTANPAGHFGIRTAKCRCAESAACFSETVHVAACNSMLHV